MSSSERSPRSNTPNSSPPSRARKADASSNCCNRRPTCQHPIAHGMTIGVVHQLEAVRIHQADHRTVAILKHGWTSAIQTGKECASIRQSRQRVEIGQPEVVVTETLSLNLPQTQLLSRFY